MDHVYVKQTDVLNAGDARRFALHKLVYGNGKLFEEFRKSLGEDFMKLSGEGLVAALDVFIERKNFKIVCEKPVVRLDEKHNWYRVDVIYTIEV